MRLAVDVVSDYCWIEFQQWGFGKVVLFFFFFLWCDESVIDI